MSHFFLGVILPIGTPTAMIRSTVERLIAPYDERLEVEPYKQRMATDQIASVMPHYNCDPTDLSGCLPQLEEWAGLPGGIDDAGLFLWSRYNPKSRWDWFEIGGRWCGVIGGVECLGRPANLEGAVDALHMQHNVIRVRDLSPSVEFFALCTPEGEWYERGRMGWFAMVADETPEKEWQAIRSEVLSAYPEHHIVGVDCHI